MSVLKTVRLTKNYGVKRGVKDIDLDIEEREIFGFIGPNGAGKSTTIRMIMQLANPTAGEIYLFGRQVRGEMPELRRKIGFLPSEINLYKDMTGKRLLEFAARSYGLELKRTRAFEYAERLQYDMNQKVKTYSLGNRKKLGIVLSVLHNPKLLILDEPTSGLDPLVQHAFFDLLKELNEGGTTIFFSTHILSEVEKLCSRVAIIREGIMVRTEQVADLASHSRRNYAVRFAEQGNCIERFRLAELDPDVAFQDGVHHFATQLPIHETLRFLSQFEIADISIAKPSLEELFMEYYGKGVSAR
ncbi:ABC transporter ATP-binding protein [Paenibacillus hemerocallicola]|uniref:ABC transporter ATP-binding protein n=1 Tax=Paenibacillus hemerocallicola TaxID=1172614 RepID=A0A5C4T6M3_9BACL|nr:ABC transporter ATP-binding protein [Paenibacillus hemerocallicola]TNJ64691.1 ABC transporter ATP-binding protein [Paenibacillus hemerocallicola]